MKYMGSKNRIAKEILPIILRDRHSSQFYVEPFCGGCNLIDKVNGNRIASDSNKYIVGMFKALQDGLFFPKEVSESFYKEVRDNKDRFDDHIVGFVGFGCSYAGKFFGGYARGKNNNGVERNYCLESYNNLMKQKKLLENVNFYCCSYQNLIIPEKSIIYCDPPYRNTTKYYKDFNHDWFWLWCEHKTKMGHRVYVSEYEAPITWTPIWEKEINSSLTKQTGSKKGIEKLFVYDS